MFVRGGFVGPGNDLDVAGLYCYYWSSVGSDSGTAYSLYFGPDRVYPSSANFRYYGSSIRCVALGG